MKYEQYSHRFADIILNSDYAIKKEIEDVITAISFDDVTAAYEKRCKEASNSKGPKGKQSTINAMFRDEFRKRDWQIEKNVFEDPENDLAIDFWKRKVGVDVNPR